MEEELQRLRKQYAEFAAQAEQAQSAAQSAQPREILQSPRLPQDDMNAVEFGKLFSREP